MGSDLKIKIPFNREYICAVLDLSIHFLHIFRNWYTMNQLDIADGTMSDPSGQSSIPYVTMPNSGGHYITNVNSTNKSVWIMFGIMVALVFLALGWNIWHENKLWKERERRKANGLPLDELENIGKNYYPTWH